MKIGLAAFAKGINPCKPAKFVHVKGHSIL